MADWSNVASIWDGAKAVSSTVTVVLLGLFSATTFIYDTRYVSAGTLTEVQNSIKLDRANERMEEIELQIQILKARLQVTPEGPEKNLLLNEQAILEGRLALKTRQRQELLRKLNVKEDD